MTKKFWVVAFLFAALTACAAPATPVATPTLAPTPDVPPERLNTPTITLEPTATPTFTPTIAPTFVFPTRVSARITPHALPALSAPSELFKFQFDDGVTQEKREAVRNGIALSQLVWGEVGPTAVITLANLDALVEEVRRNNRWPPDSVLVKQSRQRWEEARICETSEGVVFCYAARIQAPANARVDISLIHEYFHRVQGALARGRTGSLGPNWLIEGSAEYAMTVVGARYSLSDFYGAANVETERRYMMFRSRGVTKSLSTMETPTGAQDEDYFSPYSLGYLAADYLAANAGEQAVLKNYWELLRGLSWPLAFENAFGVSINEFYARFEEYRRAEFPPYCENWARGSFGITYNRALAPGSVPGVAPDLVPHIFCVTGYDYVNMSVAQKTAALKLPHPSARRGTCAANCIVIFLSTSVPRGNYALGFELPDGRKAQTQFQHPNKE